MLKLKPNCECCDRDLPPDSPDAMICSFECTFCAACAGDILARRPGWGFPPPRPSATSSGRAAKPRRSRLASRGARRTRWGRHEAAALGPGDHPQELVDLGRDLGAALLVARIGERARAVDQQLHI